MQDPLADMLTRIRNAQLAKRNSVKVPSSKHKTAVAKVLKNEGYIIDFALDKGQIKTLTINLKYHKGKAVIEEINRISKPSLRYYKGKSDLPKVNGGMGIAIISTPKGVMTDSDARAMGVGGEILCTVF